MYRVTDSYGTRRTCWTWATALQWLAACSPDAQIAHALSRRVIAQRAQRRAY